MGRSTPRSDPFEEGSMKKSKVSTSDEVAEDVILFWDSLRACGIVAVPTALMIVLAHNLTGARRDAFIVLSILGVVIIVCIMGVVGSVLLLRRIWRWSRALVLGEYSIASRDSLHDDWIDGPEDLGRDS
jgi:hypothetical protein